MTCQSIIWGQTNSIYFTTYNAADGLTDNRVSSVYQDNRGFIWAGTLHGFNRFDGKNFKNFYPNQLLKKQGSGENTNVYFENKSNSLLCIIGNYKAFSFDTYSQKLSPISSLKNRITIHLHRLSPSEIAVSLRDTVQILSNDLKLKFELIPPLNKKEKAVYIRKFDAENYFVYTNKEYFLYNIKKKNFKRLSFPNLNKEMGPDELNFQYYDPEKKELYFSNYFWGLMKFSIDGELLYQWVDLVNFTYSNPNFTSFLIDPKEKNITWITGKKGVLQLNLKTKKIIDFDLQTAPTNGAKSNIVYQLLIDKENTLWAATDKGLVRKNRFANVLKIWEMTAESNSVFHGFVLANDQNVYSNAYFGQVYRIYPKAIGKWEILNGKVQTSFVLRDRSNLIMEEKNLSLLQYSLSHGSFSNFLNVGQYFPHSTEITLGIAHSNGDLWFSGNNNGGLLHLDKQSGKSSIYNSEFSSLTDDYFTCSTEDENGDLWFGSSHSTAIVHWKKKNNSFEEINLKEKLSSSNVIRSGVNALLSDENGNIWIGFDGSGLIKYTVSTSDLTFLLQNDGLPSNYIFSMTMDGKNRIWLSALGGLVCYLPWNNRIFVFNLKNGFPTESFENNGMIYDSEKNQIWLGAKGKVVAFIPEQLLSFQKKKITLYLDEFQVNGINQLKASYSNYNFKPDENSLQIRFGVLNLQSANDVEYSYRLRGDLDKWISINEQNQINFPNLSASSYQFELKARFKGEEKWFYLKKKLSFSIAQVWYKTIWFLVLIILFLGTIIYFIVHAYYLRKIEKQKALVEKQLAVQLERDRIAFDMHDDLGSGLTRITYLSEAGLQKKESKMELEKIQNASLELVQNMSELIWAMKVENDTILNLQGYIKNYANEYLESNDIDFSMKTFDLKTDVEINGEMRKNIFLIVKEALHNVVKHANCTKVEIKISLEKNLNIRIYDNGIGFNLDKDFGGNGLNNMRKRTEKLQGVFLIARNEGTEILLKFPISGEDRIK